MQSIFVWTCPMSIGLNSYFRASWCSFTPDQFLVRQSSVRTSKRFSRKKRVNKWKKGRSSRVTCIYFSPEKVIHVPGFFSAVHLRTAIGIPMCPIVRNWLTTLTSLRIFTSFTHLHTHLQNRHWTLIRGGKNDPHLFLLVYTPMNHSAGVLSYFLPISQFQYLHFLHLICRFSHSHMVKTTYTLTRMRKSTAHTQRQPLLPTHTFSLAGLPAGSRRSQMAQCVKSIR